jgi:hypothetical protein
LTFAVKQRRVRLVALIHQLVRIGGRLAERCVEQVHDRTNRDPAHGLAAVLAERESE